MLIMLLEPFLRQLLLGSHKYRLSKSLDAEFSDEGKTRRCEEHLLSYGCGIWNVGYGDERGGFGEGVAAQNHVEGDFVLEVRLEKGEVILEGGGSGREGGERCERFFGYGAEEAALRLSRDEGLKRGLQFLGSWGLLIHCS